MDQKMDHGPLLVHFGTIYFDMIFAIYTMRANEMSWNLWNHGTMVHFPTIFQSENWEDWSIFLNEESCFANEKSNWSSSRISTSTVNANALVEEEESIEESIEEPNVLNEIDSIDIEGRLLNEEADEEMNDAPISNYTPLTEPEFYTIDDYGMFLLENCPRLNLNGEAAAIALTKWLSNPTVLSKNMLLIAHSQNVLEMWLYFQKIEEYRDLATFAQILLTNTASEAACEREFWKQRKILTNEKNRTGQELAFARIVYMTMGE